MLRPLFLRLPQLLAGGAGALTSSQFPSFYAQYLQSLGGRLDQARLQAARLEALAADLGLTAEAYIARLGASTDEAVSRAGGLASGLLEDRAQLQVAYDALAGAALWERPFSFAFWGDTAIAQATLNRYQPALPVTPEGFAYAALGLLLGLGLVAAARRGLAVQRRSAINEETRMSDKQ